MKMKKSLLAVLLSMLFMFSSFVPSISCYAVSISDINTYFDVQGKFYQILKRVTDISTTQEHQTNILNRMYDILENGGYSGSRSGQGLEQNGDVTINSNGDVILSVDLQNAIRESTQTEIDNSGYKYVYSDTVANVIGDFNNQTQYHEFISLVDRLEDENILFYKSSDKAIMAINKDSQLVYRQYSSVQAYYDLIYPYYNWNQIDSTAEIEGYYTWNSSSETYELTTFSGSWSYIQFAVLNSTTLPSYHGYYGLINTNITQYIMYMSYNDMRLGSEGLQSYYVGNDFSTSEVNTTTTLTDSMLNSSISYSDISNYVNSYYVNNQSYPTTEIVYNYINNYTGSGGGSGGDNGNGSDDDDDDDHNGFWNLVESISNFLGHIIDSLGNVLSGVLGLLTDVIDLFIGNDGLPNIVSQLIEYFLPFLPVEFIRLIEFSLMLALILGVVRLIRGH